MKRRRHGEIELRVSLTGFGCLFLLLLLLACPLRQEQVAQPVEAVESIILEPGDQVEYSYPADGQWHDSPYIAVKGSMLVLRPMGAARGVSEQALRYRIGRIPQIMSSEQPISVSEPGRIRFRFDPGFAAGFNEPVDVGIHRQQ